MKCPSISDKFVNLCAILVEYFILSFGLESNDLAQKDNLTET